jgi:hypothetical protein
LLFSGFYQKYGEIIKQDRWVMRDLWDTRVAQGRGLVTKPKKLSYLGVKRLMERANWAQGLRKKLEPATLRNIRHEAYQYREVNEPFWHF